MRNLTKMERKLRMIEEKLNRLAEEVNDGEITGKSNLTVVAKDRKHLKSLIKEAIAANGPKCDLNFIDVSHVTDMTDMFYGSRFNGDISKWDVSNVTNMDGMFANNDDFQGDISKWDVSNVKDMSSMFFRSAFNGDISKWDVSNVKFMNEMFLGSYFNKDISKWDVSNVEYMYLMFAESHFMGDIDNWDVSNVKNMKGMFQDSYLEDSGHVPSWFNKYNRKSFFDEDLKEGYWYDRERNRAIQGELEWQRNWRRLDSERTVRVKSSGGAVIEGPESLVYDYIEYWKLKDAHKRIPKDLERRVLPYQAKYITIDGYPATGI